MLKISEGAANMEEEQPVQSHKQGNIEKSIIKEHNLTWKIKLYLFFVCFLKSQRERRSRNNKVRSKFQTETAFYYWNNVKRNKKRLVSEDSRYKSFTDADVLNDGEMFDVLRRCENSWLCPSTRRRSMLHRWRPSWGRSWQENWRRREKKRQKKRV